MATVRHPKASAFVQQRLFAGLSSFTELEQRVASLPDEKSRGDALEVFAEAYLATQRKHDAESVWPLATAPLEILASLQLATQDYGVDGVLQTRLGKFSAYQVKFRAGRPALTWRELSTFMALADSPNIHSRILLTNCDELPSVLNDRQGFFCIRGSDLDRLEAEDFKTIAAWLADSVYQAPRKTPQPHQAEALEKILPAFKEHDRVSAIMACGTGKTLVALWVAENVARASTPAGYGGVPPPVGEHAPGRCLNPAAKPRFGPGTAAPRILVLLPSLALLRQTLHEWLRETSLPSLAYLCVCSDRTVKDNLDALKTEQSDMDFEVSTEPASVRAFLDADFAGVKIIFSTYQSAAVVGQALKAGESFDLGIFDEAHKTAGREGRNFAFALEDKNLPIRKRLFVTATPRHYNPHQHNREGESKLVFSMDKPEVYGPQIYRLTFAEAARRGIICGYKVIISVITSEMVTNELLSRGEVLVNGDPIRARQVANQIALHDAVEKYGTRKIFTFHKTVDSAASFVADGNEGVRAHLPEFQVFHVNGSMPTARREHEMRDFRSAPQAVMSNARCLTEGVDVPTVDMVAFLSPRRSLVDIVQATGRAMRRSPGKTTGYVLVPLYVELAAGETVEAAVNRAEFDEVWDVLNSLQEQDDVLAELIRYVAEQKGRGKGFDDSRFADRVDFGGPNLELEALRTAVTTRCLESLYSSWEVWYGKLKAFKERFGHCNVETDWAEDPSLHGWISNQRTRRRNGTLYTERIQLLDEVGFVWNWQTAKGDETWMKWYCELEKYKEEHGDSHVPRTYANNKLASWVWIQRLRRDKAYNSQPALTGNQIELLDKLGFRWDAHQQKWTENFERLKKFATENGHCEIGQASDSDAKLADWAHRQRWLYNQERLEAERRNLLESIGFKWAAEAIDLKWREMFEQLKDYHSENGSADVPHRWKLNPKLAAWVSHQRERRKRGNLSEEEIRLLDGFGFTWKSRDVGTWEDRLAEVAAFKSKHGHCEIPMNMPENPKLGRFVNNMRTQRNSGRLSPDRIAKLDALDFAWESSRTAEVGGDGIIAVWKNRFDELLRYKEANGDCKVPTDWPENPQLGRWVSQQRSMKKAGKLHPKREEMLNAIGFNWGIKRDFGGVKVKDLWPLRYSQLVEYKKQNGHCEVPYDYSENRHLGIWVSNQRQKRKANKLTPERERLLNELGFVWSCANSRQKGNSGWFEVQNRISSRVC